MSLRQTVVPAPVSPLTRLQHVLLMGREMGTFADASGMNPITVGENFIIIDGVKVSTDPNNWTGLTVKEIVRLKLNPVNMADFKQKGNANRNEANAAYEGTEFLSGVHGCKEYHFWVKRLGYVPNDAVSYYVLARPRNEESVYTYESGMNPITVGENFIIIDGVKVSTDPNNWTGLTVKEIVRLKLNPVNMADFKQKGNANRNEANAAYEGTEFLSGVHGCKEYHFWVKRLGYVPNDAVSYYVLARPRDDESVYTYPVV